MTAPILLRPVDALGHRLWQLGIGIGAAMHLLASALLGLGTWHGPQGVYLRHTLYQQLYFTAVQACGVVLFTGFVLGALAVLPLHSFGVNSLGLQADILEAVVFHQIIPFLTALLVIGRSGNAITAELGDMQSHDVFDSLLAMGIDPYRFLILPRLLALSASLLLLTLWGNLGAVLGAGMLNVFFGTSHFWQVAYACANVIQTADIFITALMVFSYGIAIGLVHCQLGLASLSSVEMERNLPRAFVRAFLACILLTALFALVRP